MSSASEPGLHGGTPRHVKQPRSAILLLHGGREQSTEPASLRNLAVIRMFDLYAGLRRRSRASAVYLLRYRLRGWNAGGGATPDPVLDARWALDRITDRHGAVPIVLLGHSMGGRTAFAVAADPRIAGICALAPWLPEGEPLAAFSPDQRFVMAHGTADRTTSGPASLRYAERLRAAGAAVVRFEQDGGRHALLDSPRLWHRFATEVSLGLCDDGPLPPAVAAAFGAQQPALRLPLTSVTAKGLPPD